MAQDINKVILTGRVGRDVEWSQVGRNDTDLAKTSIAVSMWRGEDRGEEPVWVYLNFWGPKSRVAEYLAVGMKITVIGSLNIQEYEGKWYTSVDVEETVLPDKGDSDGGGGKRGGGGKGKGRGRSSSRSKDEDDEKSYRREKKGGGKSKGRGRSRERDGKMPF